MRIRNKILSMLKEEHNGSTAIETTILMPLMFGTFILLLYFLFLILAYIAYSNAASSIAHQMNMRQTGYASAVSAYYNSSSGRYVFPQIYSYKLEPGPQDRYASTVPGQFLTEDQITCSPDNVYLRAGTYFALDRTSIAKIDPNTGLVDNSLDMIADQFILPYVQVTHITVESSKPLNFGSGASGTSIAANAVIRVSIDFRVMNPLGVFNWHADRSQYSSLITIKAMGYDVIA